MGNIINNHFKNLELCDKYSKQVNEILSEIKIYLEDEYTIDEIKKNLKMQMNMWKKRYGENYWKAVVYEEIIECKYIENYKSQLEKDFALV